MKNLRAHPQRFGKRGGIDGHDHELLRVHVVIRVLPAVQDVHHRHGQHPGVRSTDVAIQRKSQRLRGSFCGGKRYAKNRIRSQFLLRRRSIQLNHHLVDADLVRCIEADDLFGENVVDVLDCLQDSFAKIAGLVAVTQLDGLILPRGCTARHGGTSDRAILQRHIDFNSWIAARIKDFPRPHIGNRRSHESLQE